MNTFRELLLSCEEYVYVRPHLHSYDKLSYSLSSRRNKNELFRFMLRKFEYQTIPNTGDNS